MEKSVFLRDQPHSRAGATPRDSHPTGTGLREYFFSVCLLMKDEKIMKLGGREVEEDLGGFGGWG